MYINLVEDFSFPIITNDILMREALAEKPEIRFMEQANGTTVCCYLISDNDTFNSAFAREARGIVFDKNGNVISRPLHKFHNVNENERTRVENIDWTKVARVMLKRDGSMIHTVANKQDSIPFQHWNFDLKSKKSFSSDVAVAAKTFLLNNEQYVNFCNHIVAVGQTAIFEWTSPVARIVVYYPEDSLKLLHVRDNTTGRYLTHNELSELAREYNISLVEHCDDIQDMIATDPKMLFDYAQIVEGIEGWVIQFTNGDMVKLKTKWYMERHHAMTFLRERDIARLALYEQLDDLKSLLVGEGVDITEILQIEKKTMQLIDDMIYTVELTHKDACERFGDDRKSVALTYGSSGLNFEFFSLLMQLYSGKEPDYKAFYEKNYLSNDFTLRQLNLGQTSIVEAE